MKINKKCLDISGTYVKKNFSYMWEKILKLGIFIQIQNTLPL